MIVLFVIALAIASFEFCRTYEARTEPRRRLDGRGR